MIRFFEALPSSRAVGLLNFGMDGLVFQRLRRSSEGGLAVFKNFLDCHAMKASRRYFVLFNPSDPFATLKSSRFHTETKPCMVIKKTKVFDQRNVVFLNAIIVYTNEKQCILHFVT